jgi:hypothetical protein
LSRTTYASSISYTIRCTSKSRHKRSNHSHHKRQKKKSHGFIKKFLERWSGVHKSANREQANERNHRYPYMMPQKNNFLPYTVEHDTFSFCLKVAIERCSPDKRNRWIQNHFDVYKKRLYQYANGTCWIIFHSKCVALHRAHWKTPVLPARLFRHTHRHKT